METKSITPSICIIGAGFSGICAAIQLKKKLGIDSFTIFEEKEDVGGTWLQNSYPGCACDVPGHLYSLSFEPNSNWSQNFPSSDEIWNYMTEVAEKHDLYKNIQFNTQVLELKWKEDSCFWQVTFCQKDQGRTKQSLNFDFVITGSGFLRVPNYPHQFKTFKGQVLHSAEWDSSVSLENKNVAIVGSGSSAVQMIPEIAKVAKIVNVYQRSPAWVAPRLQFNFPQIIKTLFTAVPFLMWIIRCFVYTVQEIIFLQSESGSFLHYLGSTICSTFLRLEIRSSKDILNDMKPNYPFACKRVCLSENYYRTFELPNVKLHRKPIVHVSNHFIETEDGIQKADILILATGFKTVDYFSPMQVFGSGGENIGETWKNDCPSAYYGIITKSAPNLFILLGPNTILTNNSVLIILECQVNYVVKVMEHIMSSGYKAVTVKSEFEEKYMNELRTGMKRKIWTKECNSWYKSEKGDVTLLMPWSTLWYWWITKNVKFHHLQFTDRNFN